MSKKDTKLKPISDEAHKALKDSLKDRIKIIEESIKDLENGKDIETISISRSRNKRRIRKPSEKENEWYLEFLKLEKEILEKQLKDNK